MYSLLIPMYFDAITEEDSRGVGNDKLEYVVLMRTLVIRPCILSEKYKGEDMFRVSAEDFLNAFVKNVKSRGYGKKLIQDVFCNYASIIPNCPRIYRTEPVRFLQELATHLQNTPFSTQNPFSLNAAFYEEVCQVHELYADFCLAAPRLAFLMAETCPLFPTKSINGINLEETPFLPHFFSFLTVPTPFWLNHQLQYYPNTLSPEKIAVLKSIQEDTMTRVHAAQCDILRTYMTASYVSRDYILNYIATLTNANISRRVNPFGSVSSDGLMVNLTMCVLELLGEMLRQAPSKRMAKKFLSYVLCDLCRVDFIRPNIPKKPEDLDYVLNLMNWCRPTNMLARSLDDTQWWRAIRSSPKDLEAMIDNGLECKPRSTMGSFLSSIFSISDGVLFSKSILSLKSFYDYSYNYFITGKRVTPLLQLEQSSFACTVCKEPITTPPLYRCACCESYILCKKCYEAERAQVLQQYRYPYAPEVRSLFQHPEAVNQMDSKHNALTHLFTELFSFSFVLSVRPAFHPCFPFAPLCPAPYEAVRQELEEKCRDRPDEFVPAFTKAVEKIPLDAPDDNYVFYAQGDRALLRQYEDTMCLCSVEGAVCKQHGVLARKVIRMHKAPPLREGFVQYCQCYQCKTTPIIGTVYHCLHCSLELCERCYLREMKIGAGTPSHQCNHVFLLVSHPLSGGCFYQHNRNDMRTIQNTIDVFPNDMSMSGVVLDQFMANRSEAHINDDNLAAELFALSTQLMYVNMTGLFQEYQVLVDFNRLSLHRALRDMQFTVGSMSSAYVYYMEHLSYILLSLVTFYCPSNYPLDEAWGLHGVEYNMTFNMITHNAFDSRCVSKLKRLVILDVNPSPMFGILAGSLLEVVFLLFRWYMQSSNVATVKELIGAGRLDYTLLLLLICLNENVVGNVSTRFDVLDSLFHLCTVSKEKDDVVFLFAYPVVRHFLMIFCQRALIDSSGLKDPQVAYPAQLHANKIMILLLRSRTVGVGGPRDP